MYLRVCSGAAPLFLSERAMQKLKSRKKPPTSYYFDLNMVGAYWGWFDKRPYHHTGPISTWCVPALFAYESWH